MRKSFIKAAIALLLTLFVAPGSIALAQPNVISWGRTTNVPSDLTNAISVAAGVSHSVALRADGTVVAWGDNLAGQTNVPPGLTNVVAVACGANHSLALKSDGTVVAWGSTSTPNLSNVVSLAASVGVSYAVRSDGSMAMWGSGTATPVGLGNVMSFRIPTYQANQTWAAICEDGAFLYGSPTNFVLALGSSGPALTTDGRVSILSAAPSLWLDSGLSNIVDICRSTTGTYLALRSDGTIYNGPVSLSNVVAIAGGPYHSLAIIGIGRPIFTSRSTDLSIRLGRTARFYAPATGAWPIAYQWRFNGVDIPGATKPMLAVANVADKDFGTYTVVASNALGVTISPKFNLALLPILGWPWSPNITNVTSVASSSFDQALALKRDGQVVAWGENEFGESTVPTELSNVVAISSYSSSTAYTHCLALTAGGTVYSWGKNYFTNTWPSLTNIAAVSAGSVQCLALRKNGIVMMWGGGIAPYTNIASGNVVEVAAGKGNMQGWVCSTMDGRLNTLGIGSVPALSNVVSVACGEGYGLALLADGTVAAFGDNSVGQTNVPPGLSNVIAVATGDQIYRSSLALKNDGTVVAWGKVPDLVSNMIAAATNVVALDGAIALAGNGPPFLITPVVDRGAAPGAEVFFRALATGERPLHYQWQLDGADLQGETGNILHLTNLVAQQAGNYTVVVTNVYGSITSAPSALTVYNYAPALDTPAVAWASFGDTFWFPQSVVTHDGVAAAQSGAGNQSTLRGTINGPGTLKFWWKVSGTGGSLSLYLNGSTSTAMSIYGSTDWQEPTLYLGAGPQTLDWAFRNYFVVSQSAAWLDQVSFTPGVTAPFITRQPLGCSQAPGGNVNFFVSVGGTPPLNYQWQAGGVDITAATNSTLTLTNVQAGSAGVYSVSISNPAGSVITSNASLVIGHIADWGGTPAPDTITNAVAVQGGSPGALALQADGSVLSWTGGGQLAVPSNITNVSCIAGSSTFDMVVNAGDGTVIAWGDNSRGQTNVPFGVSNVVMVSAGYIHGAALKSDGTVLCWGDNRFGQTNTPTDLTNVVLISAASFNTAALRADGTVVAWGDNGLGQTNVPPDLTNAVSVRSGYDRFLALRSDGSVVAWGDTSSGLGAVPVNATNILAIACADRNLALNERGEIISWGTGRTPPSTLAPLNYLSPYGSYGLVADGLPTAQVSARNPELRGGMFCVQVRTLAGRVYRLEYKRSLGDNLWQGTPLVAGNGREVVLVDPRPVSSECFYRVRSW